MDRELFDIDKNEGQAVKPSDCVNINVGVLGHVDSGKTSICRVLTEVASTASLDKSPQSKERGITLDLGFSSFLSRVPVHLEHIK
jgi:selenocysteine-specific elongation factor